MTRRPKPKPFDPQLRAAEARAALRRPENWGANAEALAAQPDVDVVLEPDRKRVQTAQRADVFDRLLARQALSQAAHQAVRRLDADMTERRGEGERGQFEKVDGAGSRDLVTQRMIDAGKRVDDALRLVGRRDAALLAELLEPRRVVTTGPERWRLVVALITGEQRQEVQAALIRGACENLVLAYRQVDQAPRRLANVG